MRLTNSFKILKLISLTFSIAIALAVISTNTIKKDTSKNAITTRAQSVQLATNSFLETFDGTPNHPEPFTQTGQSTWDIAIHSRNKDTWEKMVPFNPHHGPNCEPPITEGATAPFSVSELVTHSWDGNYEHAVHKCANHIMTSVNGIGYSINDGYALAVLTPNHMVDFSQGEATIKFNVSTYRTTQRDWIDVWITPFKDNLQLPFSTGDVDLQGSPINSVQIEMFPPNNNSKSAFAPRIIVNGKDTGEFKKFTDDYNWYTGYEDYLSGKAGSPKDRDTVEIKISANHISVCMPKDTADNSPSQTICWANKDISTLPFNKGIVQFAHHSYTPNKDCSFYTPLTCGPDTWHWDDIYISPSLPFTMIKADKRMVTSENTPVVFNKPAPENAKLRFSAAGNVELSFNGSVFQKVQKQPSTNPSSGHVASYFVDIPKGTSEVRFRLTESGAGGVHAKDFAIWSQSASDINPSPVPTFTVSPPDPGSSLPTPTPTTVHMTPTKVPTVIPTSTPKPTVTPQPTKLPTQTPTPTVSQGKPGDANGDGVVNYIDLRIWFRNFGKKTTAGPTKGDFNRDGTVDILDYWIWYANKEV